MSPKTPDDMTEHDASQNGSDLESELGQVPATVPLEEAKAWEERALAAEAKLRDFAEAFRRYKDEHDAIRARMERDKQASVRDAVARSFGKILDALDSLEVALQYAEGNPLAEGLRLALKGIHDALAAEGLEKMSLVGDLFNPALAEAVGSVAVDSDELHNKVLAEMRVGYTYQGHVIRPAQVRVGIKG